jgi:diguanylate cyclase (GGDEF)-like protein
MFLDLDNFKTVNDSLGHAVGDELLCLVAERLGSRPARHPTPLARLAGDEFLILLGGMPQRGGDRGGQRQTGAWSSSGTPFTLHGLDVVVTASLGIAVAPRDGSGCGRTCSRTPTWPCTAPRIPAAMHSASSTPA